MRKSNGATGVAVSSVLCPSTCFRLLSCLCTVLSACISLYATDIRSIDTEVYLHRNGNAVIGQRWDVTITGGTEWYIPIEHMGQRTIRKFLVFENDRQYENEGRNWNSKRTLEEKMFRSGIAETGPHGGGGHHGGGHGGGSR